MEKVGKIRAAIREKKEGKQTNKVGVDDMTELRYFNPNTCRRPFSDVLILILENVSRRKDHIYEEFHVKNKENCF